jgi:type I restriction-modification system DNA methylase subunit
MKSKETFATLLQSHGYQYDLRPLFDDFLTMTLAAFARNIATGKSIDEDLYLQTIAKYPKDMATDFFPKLLALLTLEMEERFDSSGGNDVLGECYELNFGRKGAGQFFTPWHVCEMMARCLPLPEKEKEESRRILDPCCGSGRNLLAGAKVFGTSERYYGIDIDHTCVKMTALNLFLNGIFFAEVTWGDALSPMDFRMSYVLSLVPFGIFRITDENKSWLWQAQKATFSPKQSNQKREIVLPSQESDPLGSGSQLQLF